MSQPYENFNSQNCYKVPNNNINNDNNSGRYYNNLGNSGNLYQQNNQDNFMAHSSVNPFTNFYNMPSQFSMPPPSCPPLNMTPTNEQPNVYSNFSTPNANYFIPPYESVSQSSFQFDNMQSKHLSEPNFPRNNIPSGNVESVTSNNGQGGYSSEKENKVKCWIENWLKNTERVKITNDQLKTADNIPSGLKIYQLKDKILHISRVFNQLENLSKSLSITYKSLNEDEWKLRCYEIEDLKKQLSELLIPVHNDKRLLLEMKWKINRRKKKRNRLKRKREEYKEKKVENSIKRHKLHVSIDRWLEDMKDEVERGRRDDELKRDADSVLADVTRKKTEAKRQIALLSALLKLRQARVTAQIAIGKNISQPQTEAFNNVIERLKSLWANQLSEYLLEEQGLKVMLNEAAAEEKNSEMLKKKEALIEWEKALFGNDRRITEHQPHDLNELIVVRDHWDQFVVNEGTIMSSSIPPGWVVPVEASDLNWRKYNLNN